MQVQVIARQKKGVHMSRKRILVGVCAIVLVVAIGFGGKQLYDLSSYRKIIDDTVIETPDLTKIEDGTYNGSYDSILVAADVDVTVIDHRITSIVIIEHKTGRGAPAEVIIDEVVAQQSLDVDTITGATNSSKVILMAVQNALNGK